MQTSVGSLLSRLAPGQSKSTKVPPTAPKPHYLIEALKQQELAAADGPMVDVDGERMAAANVKIAGLNRRVSAVADLEQTVEQLQQDRVQLEEFAKVERIKDSKLVEVRWYLLQCRCQESADLVESFRQAKKYEPTTEV